MRSSTALSWCLLFVVLLSMVNSRGATQGHGSSYQCSRDVKRHAKTWRNTRVKLRENIGGIGTKHYLKLGLLNVDGLSASSFEDIQSALTQKSLDVCVLLETKRRHEDIGSDIKVDGYSVHEIRHSDTAGDKGGGGIAYYTRKSDGLLFQEYSPSIADPSLHYVQNEPLSHLQISLLCVGCTWVVCTLTTDMVHGMRGLCWWCVLRQLLYVQKAIE